MFDDVLPPALRVVVSRGLGEYGERIDTHRLPDVVPALILALLPEPLEVVRRHGLRAQGQAVRRRQVDETDRHVPLQGPADRDPLRGELGQRPERGTPRLVHDMRQQRDRRHHVLVGGERHQHVRLGRPLDQDDTRTGRVERGPHSPGRTGAVMPHP